METETMKVIASMLEDERAFIFKTPIWMKRVLGTVIAFSLIWGSLMKISMYCFFYNKDKILDKPINVLSLIDLIFNHVFVVSFGVQYLVVLFNDQTVPEFIRENLQFPELSSQVFCHHDAVMSCSNP